MKFIDVRTDFLDGHTKYYAGERVKVSDEDAVRFCAASWATDPDGKIPTGKPNAESTLEVRDGGHVAKVTSPGAK